MNAHTITFFSHKHKIAEFYTESPQFAQQDAGLLLSAEGEMRFQDTALLQELAAHTAECRVVIGNTDTTVIDQSFQMTFFTLEANMLVVLLA